jgi:hypothetical protein
MIKDKIMTLEYLKEQKEKYQVKADYFKNMGFESLSADFQNIVVLIENFIKETNNGKT